MTKTPKKLSPEALKFFQDKGREGEAMLREKYSPKKYSEMKRAAVNSRWDKHKKENK